MKVTYTSKIYDLNNDFIKNIKGDVYVIWYNDIEICDIKPLCGWNCAFSKIDKYIENYIKSKLEDNTYSFCLQYIPEFPHDITGINTCLKYFTHGVKINYDATKNESKYVLDNEHINVFYLYNEL